MKAHVSAKVDVTMDESISSIKYFYREREEKKRRGGREGRGREGEGEREREREREFERHTSKRRNCCRSSNISKSRRRKLCIETGT